MKRFAWHQPAVTGSNKVLDLFSVSSLLQQRVEQGALIDVFLSEVDKQMNALEKQHFRVPKTTCGTFARSPIYTSHRPCEAHFTASASERLLCYEFSGSADFQRF